jgi:hypothetical protein
MDQSSIATTDLDVTLQPGGTVFHPSGVSFPDSKTALFTFSTPVADGNYHATLQNGSVKDTGGQAIIVAGNLDFFALGADANHDRHVDAADQAILTAHLGQSGTFSVGDFDYNGTVNSADQAILNAQLKLWLPPVGSLPLTATAGDDSYKLRKESSSIVDLYAAADVSPTYRLITAPVSSMTFAGGGGNDTLMVDASNGDPLGAIPMSFDGGNAGADVLRFVGSSAISVTINPTTMADGGTLTYGGVENVRLDGGRLNSLALDGGVAISMTAASGTPLNVDTISAANGAKLDLRGNGLIVRSTAGEQSGELTQATAMIAAGTIFTSSPTSSLTGLGVAAASQVLMISGAQTGVFAGETVDANAVLVKYTYAGDANLDGKINVDDYGRIDLNIPLGNGRVVQRRLQLRREDQRR